MYPDAAPGPASEEISPELARVLASSSFAKSDRLRRFLEYAVERVISGELNQLREYDIAIEVFQRKPSFDQRLDPVVRVEASRLRAKLKTYYETEGKDNPLIIELPRGGYVPVIRPRSGPPQREERHSIETDAQPESRGSASASSSPRIRIRIAVVGVGSAALLTAGFVFWPRGSAADPEPEPVRLTSDSGLTAYPALSPDGKLLAYASDRDGQSHLALWIKPVSGGAPRRLNTGLKDVREPAFSPDGTEIAFRSETDGGAVFAVSVFGGEPRLIVQEGYRPRYSPDGAWILYWRADEDAAGGQILLVPATGGVPRLLTADFDDARYPVWSPDGKYILFSGYRPSEASERTHDWWVLPADGGQAVRTGAYRALMRYFKTRGRRAIRDLPNPELWVDRGIVFTAQLHGAEHLYRTAIAPGTFHIASSPMQLTHSTGFHLQPTAGGGRLAFVSARLSLGIWSLPIDAVTGKAKGSPTKLTFSMYDSDPSLSKDGRLLVHISSGPGEAPLTIQDLQTTQEWALATNNQIPRSALVSPDGLRTVYRVLDEPSQALYIASSGGGEVEQICNDCGRPSGWSPDSRYLLFEPHIRRPPLSALDTKTRARFDVAKDPDEGVHSGTFSPDGRWVAFHTRRKHGPPQLYIAPFRAGQATLRHDWIELTAGHSPAWSPNGQLLYFLCERDGFRCIWAQPLHPETKRPRGEPFPVHHFHGAERSLLVNSQMRSATVGLTAAGGKLVFAMDELSGNIWLLAL